MTTQAHKRKLAMRRLACSDSSHHIWEPRDGALAECCSTCGVSCDEHLTASIVDNFFEPSTLWKRLQQGFVTRNPRMQGRLENIS